MKNILIGVGAVIGILLLLYLGVLGLSRHIFHQTSCEQFNIDNIELRTGINIPSIVHVDCDRQGNIKTSKFVIDTSKVDIKKYIASNKFVRSDRLYVANGDNDNTKWDATLDPRTNQLNVHIEYKEENN